MTRAVDGPPESTPLGKATGSLPKPGEIFDGKYRIERTIGTGAMAVVLEATHLQLEDRVAIKLLLPQWAEQPELVDRFMREGRAATRIRSEHVVRVFDVGVVDTHPYLVMEYLDGSDLDQVLEQGGPLPVPLAVDYLLQACEAIAEAHAHGIVHRDLKPANLFLTRRADGSACVKVLDFGISKAAPGAVPDVRTTEPAAVMGSPHYMSPEQMLSSTKVDARSDLWSLGAILHELLVASPAFDGDTFASLSASVLRDPPRPLSALRADIPPRIEAAVRRCLEKEPSKRFANVAELAAALVEFGSASAQTSADRIARVLEGGQAGAPSVPPAEVKRAAALLIDPSPPPRVRGRIFGYVVAAVAVLAIGSWIVSMVVKDEHALHAAEVREDAASPWALPPTLSAASAAAAVTDAGAGAPSVVTATSHSHPKEPPSDGPSVPSAEHPPAHPHSPPKRRPHPRPPHAPPPLPDFPVPTAEPGSEPSSRPILSAPPASAAPADAPASPPAPSAAAPSPAIPPLPPP